MDDNKLPWQIWIVVVVIVLVIGSCAFGGSGSSSSSSSSLEKKANDANYYKGSDGLWYYKGKGVN